LVGLQEEEALVLMDYLCHTTLITNNQVSIKTIKEVVPSLFVQ
jgi:hypothetical protein